MLVTSRRGAAAALFALVGIFARAEAQNVPQAPAPRVLPAPPSLLQQFDALAGTVQDLTVPTGHPGQLAVDVVLAGQAARLDLQQRDVRAPGFQLLERGPQGVVLLPTPPCTTYRGALLGEPGSEVAATVADGSLTAYVKRGNGDLWLVQPVRSVQAGAGAAVHVVFRSTDSAPVPHTCGVPGAAPSTLPSFVQEDVVYGCQLAIEADYPYYQLNGSSTTATQNDITGIVNAMDVIYRRDVQVTLQVTQILVNTTTDAYTTNQAGTLLNQFASRWNAVYGGVARDVAHLFTGRPMGQSSGGAVGIAFVGTICNLGAAYGVSQSRFSSNYAYRVAVTAHELGHNFSAGHCDAAPPCNIMCSGVGGCGNNPGSFGPGEQAQIISFRQGLGCLAAVPTAPQISGVNPVQVKTWRPPQVTLTGTGFVGTTSLSVGGTPVTTGIQVISDTQLRFTPPAGKALGVHGLTATNSAGTSNNAALWYIGANPVEQFVPAGIIGGSQLNWEIGGWPNDFAYTVVSLFNTTTPIPGGTVLSGASVLWSGLLDARGMAQHGVLVPPAVLNGVRIYSQTLDFDLATLQLRSSSTVSTTFVVF